VNVVVTAFGGPSNPAGSANNYTYIAAPTVTNLDPKECVVFGGAEVMITGTGFNDVASVKFGGVSVGFTRLSSTKIKVASVPSHAEGKVEVVVTTPGGSSSTAGGANDFTYFPFNMPTMPSITIPHFP
jgi:hypothetical protein